MPDLAMVALLAEGVGRNQSKTLSRQVGVVALLAEGVGRNFLNPSAAYGVPASPSSRRAWVEIGYRRSHRRKWSGRPPRGGRG